MSEFRENIIIKKGDVDEKIVEIFKQRLVVFQGDKEELLFKVNAAVREFIIRGEQLAALGSVFEAKRVIEGTGYRVIVSANYGRKPGFIARLFGMKG